MGDWTMKRILLKLSGEALSRNSGEIYDSAFVDEVASSLAELKGRGYEIALVIGAGNIWRGRQGTGMDQCRADYMGMLATVVNSLALQDVFIREGMKARVMSAVEINAFVDTYTARDAIEALENGEIVIFGGGLGIPFFSTDTAAALRAAEIGADCILMAKNIDAIYSADPKKDPNAVRYTDLTYAEILDKNLRALDLSAATFCMDNNISGYAFGLANPENIYRAVMGEPVGTAIHN